jgi:hypothetical protein
MTQEAYFIIACITFAVCLMAMCGIRHFKHQQFELQNACIDVWLTALISVSWPVWVVLFVVTLIGLLIYSLVWLITNEP